MIQRIGNFDQDCSQANRAEHSALKRPAIGEYGESNVQHHHDLHFRFPSQARHSAYYQGPRGGRGRTSPKALAPIVEKTHSQKSEHTAEERPLGRQPTRQRPVNGGAHGSHAEPDSEPGVAESDLSERQ